MTCEIRNREWIRKGIGINKRNDIPIRKRFAIINQTITIVETLEYFRIDKTCRTEHSTINMNVTDIATDACIINLNCVLRSAIWKWSCWILSYFNSRLAAMLINLWWWWCIFCIKTINKNISTTEFFFFFLVYSNTEFYSYIISEF
jgi:hypothetical protein